MSVRVRVSFCYSYYIQIPELKNRPKSIEIFSIKIQLKIPLKNCMENFYYLFYSTVDRRTFQFVFSHFRSVLSILILYCPILNLI